MKHTSAYLKKTLSIVMALIMVFGAFSSAGIIGLIASAADGTRGDKALFEGSYWQFYDDGELVFTGNTMLSVNESETNYWRDPKSLENFGDRVTSITIAPSVKIIEAEAFRFLGVTTVFIPDSVTSVAEKAFEGSSIKTIYFPGHDTLWKTVYQGEKVPTTITVNFDHRHTEDSIKHHAEATCVKKGYEGDWYCSVCGAFVKAGKELDKTSHNWSKEATYIVDSNGVPEKETCKDNGRKARYCTVCGEWDYTSVEIVPADTSKHEFVMPSLDDRTVEDCADLFSTQKGCDENFVDLTCKHCGKKLSDLHGIDEKGKGRDYQFYLDYVDKNNVKVGSYVLFGNDASGVNSGWKKLSAADQARVVNKKAVEEYGMYREQMTYKSPADAAKHHRIIDTKKSVAPTCTEEGKTVVTCEWCKKGYNQEFKVAALGHSDTRGDKEVIVETTAPRCPDYDKDEKNSDGDGEKITKCVDCGVVLSKEKLNNLHAEGTRSGTWVTVVEPTCVKDGVQQLRCNLCKRWIRDDNGELLTQPVAKTPSVHTPSRWVYTKDPSCTDTGERIKFCLNEGCPYYVGNDTAATAAEASDRAALDLIQDVVRDTNRDNYNYATDTDPSGKEIYDVTEEINTVILARYKSGELKTSVERMELLAKDPTTETDAEAVTDALADEIEAIIETAVKHHQRTRINIETLEEETKLDDDYYNENFTEVDEGCVDETAGTVRYVFSEIVPLAAKKIVEKRSVINEVDDIVKALEDAWLELGDTAIADALASNKGDAAELTNKAIAKEEVAALSHNFVRVPYTTENVEGTLKYYPVVEVDGKWYKIKEFVEDDEGNWTPVKSEEEVEKTHVIDKIDCTKGGGIILNTCTRCAEQTKELVSERVEHDTETETVNATCLNGKYKREYCKYCDYENKTELGAALGHDPELKEIRPATCSKAGIKVEVCKRCGVIDETTYQTIQTLPHTDSHISEKADCLNSGREGVVCSVCGRFEGTVIPALGHDWENIVTAPDCTNGGYTTPTCSRCGLTKEPINKVPAAGHQYGETLTMAATCTKGSYSYEICKVCGHEKVYNELTNALGHNMTTVAAKAATCTADGYTERVYCTRPGCGYVEKESTVVKATGHKPENVPYKAASCTEDGNEAYVRCSICNEELEKKVVLPKTGHQWKISPAVEATCETAGQTEGKICEICGEYEKTPVTVPAKGHTWGATKTVKEALLTGNDVLEHSCTVCGKTEQWEETPTFFRRIVRVILFVFTLPFKLMARANGE